MSVGYNTIMGNTLATLVLQLYRFLYNSSDMTSIFKELDKYIYSALDNNYFKAVMTIIIILGNGLLATTFLMQMFDKVTRGDFSPEVIIKHTLKYVFLYMVLINANYIFRELLSLSTAVFTELSKAIETSGQLTAVSADEINFTWLSTSIARYYKMINKLGLFILTMVPFVISQIYYIVMYFFAASRTLECAIRTVFAPLVVGVSYFGTGSSADIVRFTKKTMGCFFQIVVILMITTSVSVVQSSLTSDISNENGGITSMPVLVEETDYEQFYPDSDGNIIPTYVGGVGGGPGTSGGTGSTGGIEEGTEEIEVSEELKVYTEESVKTFIQSLYDFDTLIITVGLMIAGLLLVVKSNIISAQLFA